MENCLLKNLTFYVSFIRKEFGHFCRIVKEV